MGILRRRRHRRRLTEYYEDQYGFTLGAFANALAEEHPEALDLLLADYGARRRRHPGPPWYGVAQLLGEDALAAKLDSQTSYDRWGDEWWDRVAAPLAEYARDLGWNEPTRVGLLVMLALHAGPRTGLRPEELVRATIEISPRIVGREPELMLTDAGAA